MRETDKTKLLTKNLSSFMSNIVGIERIGKVANIIVDTTEDRRPIRLLGFSTDAALNDYEVCEEGYLYYKELYNLIKY